MRFDEYATTARQSEVAPAFVKMANRMVYCTLSTAARCARPRLRMVRTLWEWDGTEPGRMGSIGTLMKRAHLARIPYLSCSYWYGAEATDTRGVKHVAELLLDKASWIPGWERFRPTPPPPGHDTALLTQRADGLASPRFGVLRLETWHLRVFTGEFARSNGAARRLASWHEGERI